MGNAIDMSWQTPGRLLVIEREENNKRGQARWRCVCQCGNETVVLGSDLRSGNTVSCGCFQAETLERQHNRSFTHGHAQKAKRHPLYGVWKNRRARRETELGFLEFLQQQN